MTQGSNGKVALFPPLPPRPEPPRFPPDQRQAAFHGITGRLAEQITGAVADDFGFATANTVTGFPASAVDLGRLREALESGIAAFDSALVHERWDIDVSRWLRATVLRWIQRCKSIRLDKRERGIRVEIETQDDHGYYQYAFDVFPGKK